MNLFQIQERLKNYSQDQLVNEMRAPSGSAPQYLILSELQRRKRMMTESQAQPQQEPSVAEEAVASAGVPQGGLAQMAQALAPQTDMVQNTARMAEGGELRSMSEGGRATGLAAINRNLAGFMPMRRGARGNRFMNLTPDAMGAGIAVDALIADPRVQTAATTSNMSPEEYISALNSEQFQNALDMLNTPVENAPMRDEGRISDEEFMASRYDGPGGAYSVTERSGVPGRARLSESGLTGVEPTPTVSAEDIRRMANENRIDESADGFSVIGAGIAGPYTNLLESMAETPLFPERRGMQFGETPVGSIQRDPTEEPMDETLRRILANSEAAIARDSGAIPVSSTYDEVPFRSARATQPDLADDARAARTAAYVEENLARDARGLPERTSAGMSDAAMAATAGSPFDTGFVMRDVFAARGPEADNGTGEDLPFEEILRMERERLAGQFEDQATQDEANLLPAPMTDNELANLELAGFDATDQSGGDGIGLGDIGRAIGEAVGFGDAMRVARENQAAAEEARAAEAARAQEVAASFESEAEAADREIAALPTRAREEAASGSGGAGGSGGGSGGGAGGGAGGGMGSSDDQYEQDKWLALAQFGLGLMSSQAPTFGQAIGDAGQAGIQALLSARAAKNERDLAAQERADRLAAAARSAASERGGFRDDEVDAMIRQSNYLRSRANELRGEGGIFNSPEDEERYNALMDEARVYDSLIQGATLSQFPEVVAALQN